MNSSLFFEGNHRLMCTNCAQDAGSGNYSPEGSLLSFSLWKEMLYNSELQEKVSKTLVEDYLQTTRIPVKKF